MAKTEPVPCIVRDDDAVSAEEDSLAENVHREPLHPLDQFRAMQKLVEQGSDIETVAAKRWLAARPWAAISGASAALPPDDL